MATRPPKTASLSKDFADFLTTQVIDGVSLVNRNGDAASLCHTHWNSGDPCNPDNAQGDCESFFHVVHTQNVNAN